VLVGIWLLFAVLYALILSDSHGLLGWRGFAYSAAVLTLQRPDSRPDTLFTQILVTAEAILGPVQAALLALAIRRKFMR
jgi:hypothetical protein